MARFVACVLFLLLCPSLALADVISDEEAACRKKEAGDACKVDGDEGACVESTCGRIDYSQDPPGSKSEPCLKCDVDAEPTRGEDGGLCTVASLAAPLPLSLTSLALGAALLFFVQRRRNRT